jgi:competence protein ComEA
VDRVPASNAAPGPNTPPPAPVVWSHSAQLAAAFLLGLGTAFLLGRGFGHLSWSSRPTELDRQAGFGYRVDINHAPRAELLQLPGIGGSLAERIEAYRRERGGFGSVDNLRDVHGVGPATFEQIRPWVRVEHATGEPVERPQAARGTVIAGSKEASLTAPINVNRASREELQRLPGIGVKMSQRILDERTRGLFKSVDDLRRVSGIGPKTLQRLRPYVTIEGPIHVATVD